MKKWLKILSTALLLIVVGIPLITTLAYLDGSARLKGVGFPSPQICNIDPEWRCGKQTSGCIVFGYERFTQGLSNATLRFLIRKFGFMEGSYLGEYPDTAAVRRLMETEARPVVLVDKSIAVEFETAGEPEQIDHAVPEHYWFKNEFYENASPNGQLKGRCVQKPDYFILCIDEHPRDSSHQYYYLFERANNRQFALYQRCKYGKGGFCGE